MKALVKKFDQEGLWMDDVPVPEIGPNDVLIKTKKTSICGTDLHIYKWDDWARKTIPVPMVVGHEFVGTVAKIGKNVTSVKEGDRVSGEGHITCGNCLQCRTGKRHLCPNTKGVGVNRHGCFAEYFNIPAENVFPLPDAISDDIASILDPLGNATHTALSFPLIGEDILITGAGPIGIMSAAIAKKAGARKIVITDRNEYRLALAKKMGATDVVNIDKTTLSQAVRDMGLSDGFSVGLEMSGHPGGLRSQMEEARHGAHIGLLGILPPGCTIDWDLVIFKMLEIKGIYGREIFKTWYQMSHMIESGLDMTPMITHRFPIDQFIEGFETVRSGNCGKVILDW